MNRREIRKAARVRIREVLRDELHGLEEFTRLVTRKSVDAADGTVVVCGSSPVEAWNEVEAEAKRFWKRLARR